MVGVAVHASSNRVRNLHRMRSLSIAGDLSYHTIGCEGLFARRPDATLRELTTLIKQYNDPSRCLARRL